MTALMQKSEIDFETARFHMVEGQIRPNKVRDGRILDRMSFVPREAFVPNSLQGIAYIDEDIPIGSGRYLMEPMILARLLEEAKLQSTDHVLDIAPGTGYSTAVLAPIVAHVVALESDHILITEAKKNLAALEITNVEVLMSDMTKGEIAKAPYDLILINGSVEFVPDELFGQLNEAGRLLVVLCQYGPAHAAHTGEARLYEKKNGHVSYRTLFDANVKPLPGFKKTPHFKF